MIALPVNSDGKRKFTLNTGLDVFIFRTYYSTGQEGRWCLDISDSGDNPILTGLNLVPGSNNLLKGNGAKMEGYQLYCLLMEGEPGATEALGNNLQLLLYNPGETNLYEPKDPLDNIGRSIL